LGGLLLKVFVPDPFELIKLDTFIDNSTSIFLSRDLERSNTTSYIDFFICLCFSSTITLYTYLPDAG